MGPAQKGLSNPSDRALAHNIAATVLRWMAPIDAMIDGATRLPLADDAKARMVLRVALAQVLRLGTPPHAAIATALPLVDGGPRRLVHGVFSTIMKSHEAGALSLPDHAALPREVADRWRAAWGEEMVAAAARMLGERPPVDLSLKAETTDAPGGVPLFARHRRLPADAAPGFEGDWWAQDLAAQIPAALLGGGGGRRALDLCAAPGGKAMQLASAGWRVLSVDSSAKRMARYAENFARLGLESEVAIADALDWEPERRADAVLLDAPCSATGIFRRHPDTLHATTARQIADCAERQDRLLARAADWVAPGGRLVYAVCSLEREEGEDRIAAFLASRADYAIDPVRAEELPDGVPPSPDGTVRTLPGTIEDAGGLDGFYIARLRRAE